MRECDLFAASLHIQYTSMQVPTCTGTHGCYLFDFLSANGSACQKEIQLDISVTTL